MSDPPKIFYLCFDHQSPTGGQKSMYRHVDILNDNGIEAYALHMTEGFRLTWFANETCVIHPEAFKSIFNSERDYLVASEDQDSNWLNIPGKKVILNQNIFYGYLRHGLKQPDRYPYLHPEVVGAIVKSEHNRELLNLAYPRLPVYSVTNSIDTSRFQYSPVSTKNPTILCYLDKNPEDQLLLYHILASRAAQGLNPMTRFAWRNIHNVSESDLARCLSESLALIFLSTKEGFGRMPIEAMLSGCLVIAYDIPPMNAFLRPEIAYLAPVGDIVKLVTQIEGIIGDFATMPQKLDLRSKAAEAVGRQFSKDREAASLLAIWREIIGS